MDISKRFCTRGATVISSAYFINEDEMEEASARIRRILDAKYEAANIDDVCAQQGQLSQVEKDKLK